MAGDRLNLDATRSRGLPISGRGAGFFVGQFTGRTGAAPAALRRRGGPQPGSLDGAHRSGRASGYHQDPPTTLLLPRRTAHPLGATPHFASSPALALGSRVQSRPGTIASPSISCLTAPLAPTHPLDFPTASKTRARSVPERLWPHAALTISPSTTTTGRRHTLGVATAPCTQPYLLESNPPRLFPLPLIPCLPDMATSLRWIRA